jgi:universal stress protein A
MHLGSILCPVDFSPLSRQAFEYASALATASSARLIVLNAVDPLLAQAATASFHDDYLQQTRDELRRFCHMPGPIARPWTPAPTHVVTVGEPGEQVLKAARFYDADLIVMGTQGLGGVRRMMFGSTAAYVLRHSEIPVLAIPRGARRVRMDLPGPVIDAHLVVAAMDLGPGSLAVARAAMEVAATYHARLLLAHALRPIPAIGCWEASRAIAQSTARAAAEASLAALAARLDHAALLETVVIEGHAPDAVHDLAAVRGADLLIIGSAASCDSQRPGSIAYRALCLTEIPVLAVPPTADRLAFGAVAAHGHLVER